MNAIEFRECREKLGLTQVDAAQLLSVDPRTVRRWAEENGGIIPGPAEQALRAWVGLQRQGVPWRAEDTDDEQIALHRQHAIELYALLLRVEARGGPRAPWQVDIEGGVATLGPVRLSFYKLRNGSFSPAYYRRSDLPADVRRDWTLIEDGFACIARAIADARGAQFVFGATVQNGHVLMWDLQRVPTVVMKISCDAVRRVLCRNPDINEEQCRLLVDCNKELMAELAGTMFAGGRYTVRAGRIRVIEPATADLQAVAGRFSTSALQVVPIWLDLAARCSGRLTGAAN
jgi:transcriptional regulator with XRE-family HTH domain